MNAKRRPSAAVLTVTLLVSVAVLSQAKNTRKNCLKSCNDRHAAALKACDNKIGGKAKSDCKKQVNESLAGCRRACSK